MRTLIYIFFVTTLFTGCVATTQKAFITKDSTVKLRSIQTRVFDTNDKEKVMQAIISTMQDLDFVIDKVDLLLGSITGSKFLGYDIVKMTVTVRPRGEHQLSVRVNAQCGIQTIKDPQTYQDFFIALEKALFLTAHNID